VSIFVGLREDWAIRRYTCFSTGSEGLETFNEASPLAATVIESCSSCSISEVGTCSYNSKSKSENFRYRSVQRIPGI